LHKLLERIPLYLNYFLLKVDEHSLQAPYAFSFYTGIIKNKNFTPIEKIENERLKLLKSQGEIAYQTFGIPSKLSKTSRSKISKIARSGISSLKKSLLLASIISELKPKTILELGTSLGINTCYLAETLAEGDIFTFEGNKDLIMYATDLFDKLNYQNIKLIEGNIDQTLTSVISKVSSIDLVFIDANHHSKSVLKYFDLLVGKAHSDSVFVFDDIRWSKDMYQAWLKIIQSADVSCSFDLGDIGIVTFEKNLSKQNYIADF